MKLQLLFIFILAAPALLRVISSDSAPRPPVSEAPVVESAKTAKPEPAATGRASRAEKPSPAAQKPRAR